jgi:3-dehydroquinate synthase
METVVTLEQISINSQFGAYKVKVLDTHDAPLDMTSNRVSHYIVDEHVYDLHKDALIGVDPNRCVFIDAQESNKNANTALNVAEELLGMGLRRNGHVGVIGGGITQDLATFACSIIMRGVPWTFVPTSLLAQSDSCIGGKSSINIGSWKNGLGNFYPPKEIVIAPHFLTTLNEIDLLSGFAEIAKVHFINGRSMINAYACDVQNGVPAIDAMPRIIHRALTLKANIIEEDEFDTGVRLTMNYGHSFGHAIEASTNFAVPHGIAVNFGMSMANYLAYKMGLISENELLELEQILSKTIDTNLWHDIDPKLFVEVLRKDKKNTANSYNFVLLTGVGQAELVEVPFGQPEDELCSLLKKFNHS